MEKLSKVDEFRTALHKAGFKATPSRLAVLSLLSKSKKPLSVKAIREHLPKEDADQATLYRMVHSLSKAKIIRFVDFQHGHAHYELTTQTHHHHIICECCGKVIDISKCDTSGLEKQAKKIGQFAEINKHSLEFFGVCNTCAKKNLKSK